MMYGQNGTDLNVGLSEKIFFQAIQLYILYYTFSLRQKLCNVLPILCRVAEKDKSPLSRKLDVKTFLNMYLLVDLYCHAYCTELLMELLYFWFFY